MAGETEEVKRSDKAKVRDTGVDKSKDKKSSVGDNLGDRKDTVGERIRKWILLVAYQCQVHLCL